MRRWLFFVGCLLTLGCGQVLGGNAPATAPGAPAPELRSLRMRVADDIAIVVDGSADAELGQLLAAAVAAELDQRGVTLVRGRDGAADVTVRLETRVRGAVSFLRGHLTLTAEKGDTAVAVASTEDELHREGEFVTIMARKAVAALLQTPAVRELAAQKSANRVPRSPAPVAPAVLVTARRPPPTAVIPATTRAKAHANRATSLYNLGHFQAALAEYEAAYMAVQDPPFLFNIAQCHRKLGNNKNAIDFYRSYLRVAPDASNRTEVQKRIADLERGRRSAR
jgi:hypothetical protein